MQARQEVFRPVNPQYAFIHAVAPDDGHSAEDVDPSVYFGRNGASTMAQLMAAPEGIDVPIATEPQQRVIQIALGSEHGILLTEGGIVFTWGDNRYGQLGRKPFLKEESGKPFPIRELLDDEIRQVAAGKHHCLALAASGLVSAWGRNKSGQLGCGDYRDKVSPVYVCHEGISDSESQRLGARSAGPAGDNARIISISAAHSNSVAVARCADVWQWGQISEEFKLSEVQGAKGKKEGEKPVPKNRPHKVTDQSSYRTQMRREPVSVTKLGRLVIDKEQWKSAELVRCAEEQVETVRSLQEAVARERADLSKMDRDRKRHEEEQKQKTGASGKGHMSHLQDTVAMLEREIQVIAKEIDLYEKNIKSCEQQQHHTRKQIDSLVKQSASLNESMDRLSLSVLEAKKGGPDRRKLEEQLNEIKDFVEANQNTRMTLLDQRAETDKERQKMQRELDGKKAAKNKLASRLRMVLDLSKSTNQSDGASDTVVAVLLKQKDSLSEYFESKLNMDDNGENDSDKFIAVKREQEKDHQKLLEVDQMVAEMLVSEDKKRTEGIKTLLADQVKLCNLKSGMQTDRCIRDDLDLTCFFKGSAQPQAPAGSMFQGGDERRDQMMRSLPAPP